MKSFLSALLVAGALATGRLGGWREESELGSTSRAHHLAQFALRSLQTTSNTLVLQDASLVRVTGWRTQVGCALRTRGPHMPCLPSPFPPRPASPISPRPPLAPLAPLSSQTHPQPLDDRCFYPAPLLRCILSGAR